MDANIFVHHDYIPFEELVRNKPITIFGFRRCTCLLYQCMSESMSDIQRT